MFKKYELHISAINDSNHKFRIKVDTTTLGRFFQLRNNPYENHHIDQLEEYYENTTEINLEPIKCLKFERTYYIFDGLHRFEAWKGYCNNIHENRAPWLKVEYIEISNTIDNLPQEEINRLKILIYSTNNHKSKVIKLTNKELKERFRQLVSIPDTLDWKNTQFSNLLGVNKMSITRWMNEFGHDIRNSLKNKTFEITFEFLTEELKKADKKLLISLRDWLDKLLQNKIDTE